MANAAADEIAEPLPNQPDNNHPDCNPAALWKSGVRELCEFAARRGSINGSFAPTPTAREGIAGHQWLQARYSNEFQAEYTLGGVINDVELQGRLDLVRLPDATNSVPHIIEIKTFHGRYQRLSEGQKLLHLSQLRLYGALLCQRLNCNSIILEVVYVELNSRQTFPELHTATREELLAEAAQLCDIWKQWQRQEQAHRQQRNALLADLPFLASGFRPGQRDLSTDVYKAIYRGQRLLLEAPTGLGKTLGVLYPALKSMGINNSDRLFFLTARSTGRQLALDGLQRLLTNTPDAPAPLRVLELIAKEKACEYPDSICHEDFCPLAADFYERLSAARLQAAHEGLLDQANLQRIARTHQICPWYLGREMAVWSDVAIGDVNHYFDGSALLFYLTQEQRWQSVVVVDEAHNLIDRARGMYSTTLEQSVFELSLRGRKPGFRDALQAVQRAWQTIEEREFERSEASQRWLDYIPNGIADPLNKLQGILTEELAEDPQNRELQQTLFACVGFLELAKHFGDHSIVELQRQQRDTGELWERSHLILSIHNLIPADFLQQRFQVAKAAVLFSATLHPADYYCNLLGLPEDTHSRQTPSPFHSSQIHLDIIGLDTRAQKRNQTAPRLAQDIQNHYQQHPGNHLVFFSSFDYLQQVVHQLKQLPDAPTVVTQASNLSERQQKAFINTLRKQRGVMAFAVLGGVFSEGIDLPGDALISVSIVTLGLPPFDRYHKLLKERLDERFGSEFGWSYTWLYPGLRRVVQAAGRLIRTPEDRGHIRLYDQRYHNPEVQDLLPDWWFKSNPNTHTQ
ncbi:ATP-dependent DNA helicase [Parathalassolituus penaei]|uniref:ATP-dependent DNA helicase n=1 Tax=Parathalassolituus penaei TaxID=2997323 RepID=A0A9X3EJU2_9GAMM|nr:ATP-dependent DNA helicase [Parathalassolituus penaei]MCY0963898.1 ATP-dependent DNA helicase [Parathalassolituus penaei]